MEQIINIQKDINNPLLTLPITDTSMLKDLNFCFCIDVSGSTGRVFADKYTYLEIEKDFAKNFLPFLTKTPKFVAWDDNSKNITSLSQLHPDGGTKPNCIFENQLTLQTILNTDVAVIITDGQIGIHDINEFSKCMTQQGSHLKAIIGVIVGRRTRDDSNIIKKPSEIDVSVLVPTMISNGCILFHNLKDTYIMWSCGVFKTAWNPSDITENLGWQSVSTIGINQICNVSIPIPDQTKQKNLIDDGYIPFGAGFFFHPDHLLEYKPTWEQLLELPFDRICQYFRVTRRYSELLKWFKNQQERFVQEFMVDNGEKENIERLVHEMDPRNSQQRNNMTTLSYVQSRNCALARRYINNEEIESLFTDTRIIRLMQFFRRMMQIMEEDYQTQNLASSYVTSKISSSRYCTVSSGTTSTPSIGISCSSITSDFHNPLEWYRQFKIIFPNHGSNECECTICYELSVPFIIVRKHIDKNNIGDLVDNIAKYFYPNVVCNKCATYFCDNGIDPVRVPCYAAIPLVNLIGNSKIYFIASFAKLTNCIYNEIKTDNNNPDTNLEILSIINLLIGLLNEKFSNTLDVSKSLAQLNKYFQ